MGVEETYWGISDQLFLQHSPHLLKPGNSKKGVNCEVDMREKEQDLEKEEKIGIHQKTYSIMISPIFQLVKKAKETCILSTRSFYKSMVC